jgi:hypothetical protein
MEPRTPRTSSSKQVAVMFLLGALLVGGAMGFATDRLLVRDRLCPRWGDQRAARDRLADDLGLSTAQRAAVDTVLDRRNDVMDTLMQPIRPQLDSVRDAARAEIRRRLTPEQQAEWDRILAEMKAGKLESDRRRGR